MAKKAISRFFNLCRSQLESGFIAALAIMLNVLTATPDSQATNWNGLGVWRSRLPPLRGVSPRPIMRKLPLPCKIERCRSQKALLNSCGWIRRNSALNSVQEALLRAGPISPNTVWSCRKSWLNYDLAGSSRSGGPSASRAAACGKRESIRVEGLYSRQPVRARHPCLSIGIALAYLGVDPRPRRRL